MSTEDGGGGLGAAKQRLNAKGSVPFDVKKALAQNQARQESEQASRSLAMEKLDKDLKAARNSGDAGRIRTLEAQKIQLTKQSANQFSTMRGTIDTQHAKIKSITRAIQRPGGK